IKKTSNILSSKLFTSKIHKFENLPEPKNATEAFYISRSYDFSLSDNTSNPSKSSKINFRVKNHPKKLKMENGKILKYMKVQDNPNLHSEEKDKTPDDGF
ncbi:hypothetical protein RhiirA1_421481, partial [Rhizophagus irregularis]